MFIIVLSTPDSYNETQHGDVGSSDVSWSCTAFPEKMSFVSEKAQNLW